MRQQSMKLLSFIMTLSILLFGWHPLRAAAAPAPEHPVRVEVGQASGAREDIVDVPVFIDPGDYGVWKYSLNISYDPAVLELAEGASVTDEADAAGPLEVTTAGGVLQVEASSFGDSYFIMDEKQKVFTIHFKIKKTAPSGPSHVTVNDSTYVEDEEPQAVTTVTPGMVTVSDTAAVTIGSGSGSAGQTASVPVYLENASADVGSYGIRIGFDPTALEVSSIAGDSGERFISSFDNTEGTLIGLWADAAGGDRPLRAGDRLFTIHFKVKAAAAAGDRLPLVVTDANALESFSVTDTSGKEMMKTVNSGMVTIGLTVASSDPTGAGTDGKTKITVAETAGAGNIFKYKNFAGAAADLPDVGDAIEADYALLPEDGLVEAANGDRIVVAEVNAAGQAVRSGQTTAMVASGQGTVLAAPSNLSATAGDGQVALSWNGVAEATYYNIYMGTLTGEYGATPAATVTGATYAYHVTGLANGQTYYFAVKAGDEAGIGPNSNEASAIPQSAGSNQGERQYDGGL
ncbi:cohesin domain-containing protein [Cohnella rhizosphaerae]|uniref:Cohesin domain-containing protein n=1 Tax=Cohnella rhizosphaerae TaxID=1457232 RepID=A0A9X4L0P0_9BACL|nr:cohesin domain-containing protein [Cohnella rhizosphaerae]MDG0811372.1 cohesin domain-containing protein [Cohnella rhizosphaerae]